MSFQAVARQQNFTAEWQWLWLWLYARYHACVIIIIIIIIIFYTLGSKDPKG